MNPANPAADQDYSAGYKRFVMLMLMLMLTIVYALNFIDRQILVILQEPIQAEMGLSDAQLGLLSGFAFAVIYVTAGIPIAYWADRGNRRNIISLVSYGSGNFLPSFLIRNHGLSLAEVGTVLALVVGLSGAIGTFLGGYLGDKFGSTDKRWYLWVPMLGIALAYFPYLYVLLTDNTTQMALVAIAMFALAARRLPADLAKRCRAVP